MAITNQTVAELYIATFNRAPDTAGLNYWVDQSNLPSIENIAQSFFDQSETQSIYTSSMTYEQKVSLAYLNLFNREPDAAGLSYWVGQLNTQVISQSNMIIALINGAHAPTGNQSDATILDNKTEVGLYYVDANLNDVETAYSIMNEISSDYSTVGAAVSQIDTIVNNTIFLDPSCDTGRSNNDYIINMYNRVKVTIKLANPDAEVQFFNDINNDDQQDVLEYVNSVVYSRTDTQYTALLDLVSQTTQDGSPLPDGEHNIKVMQLLQNAQGEQTMLSVSLPLTITLDTTAPTIQNINLASNEGSLIYESNYVSKDYSFTFSGNTEANASVVLYDEVGDILATSLADASGNFVFQTVQMQEEVHGHAYKFTLRATDIAGNSPDQNEVPIWVSVDKDQPGSPIMSYDNSYDYIDMTYIKHSKIFVGPTTGDISGYTTWYSLNSGSTWTELAPLESTFDIAPGSYSAGQIQAKMIDGAGNSSGTVFNANNISISSSYDINTTMLMGYIPPYTVGEDTNIVTPNLGSDHILNNTDQFFFYDDISMILSLGQVGDTIKFNNTSIQPISTAPTNGIVTDQHYFVVKGSYDEETESFSVNDSYSGTQLATLIVFDGDESALETTQQGVVLVGISPAHLDLNVGYISLY